MLRRTRTLCGAKARGIVAGKGKARGLGGPWEAGEGIWLFDVLSCGQGSRHGFRVAIDDC